MKKEQKLKLDDRIKLIQGATQFLVDVLDKNPATTVVVIDEVNEYRMHQFFTKKKSFHLKSVMLIKMINMVAAAVAEQSATPREIAGNVNQAAQRIEDMSEHVPHSSTMTNESEPYTRLSSF